MPTMAKMVDNYCNATGKQVVTWANQGLHGGLDVGGNTSHVWNDAMDSTVNYGELLSLAMDYLRSKGLKKLKSRSNIVMITLN